MTERNERTRSDLLQAMRTAQAHRPTTRHMTMTDEPEIYELLHKIRYDATAIQAKVTDALTMLSRMNLPDADAPTHVCPHAQCRLAFHSERRLSEHLANVHGIPARANPTAVSSLGEG